MNDKSMELNILWLWPDILNLHGCRGNAMAFARVAELYGIKTNIKRVARLSDDFDPNDADIIVLGSGELNVMPDIAGALLKQLTSITNFAKSGGVLFATGTTAAALGVHTTRLDGSHVYGIGLLDMECAEREVVLGDDCIFHLNGASGNAISFGTDNPIYGIQIQMIDIKLAEGQNSLGKVSYGYGNNGQGVEGAVKEGVVFTNTQGPVLVKNPWLTLDLIRKAVLRKNPEMDPDTLNFDSSLFEIELASARAIQAFNDKKEKSR